MAIADIWVSTLGGVLIGLSASILLATLGRVAGISGIVGSLLKPRGLAANWQLGFVAGLLLAGWLALGPSHVGSLAPPATLKLVVAGLLIGVGTRIGNGCTSGHGVCGISRLSLRSIAATGVFMFVAAAVVAWVRHVGNGGQL